VKLVETSTLEQAVEQCADYCLGNAIVC
jgi:hypothetical protein